MVLTGAAFYHLLQTFRDSTYGVATVLHSMGRKREAREVMQQVQEMDEHLRRLRGG